MLKSRYNKAVMIKKIEEDQDRKLNKRDKAIQRLIAAEDLAISLGLIKEDQKIGSKIR